MNWNELKRVTILQRKHVLLQCFNSVDLIIRAFHGITEVQVRINIIYHLRNISLTQNSKLVVQLYNYLTKLNVTGTKHKSEYIFLYLFKRGIRDRKDFIVVLLCVKEFLLNYSYFSKVKMVSFIHF